MMTEPIIEANRSRHPERMSSENAVVDHVVSTTASRRFPDKGSIRSGCEEKRPSLSNTTWRGFPNN